MVRLQVQVRGDWIEQEVYAFCVIFVSVSSGSGSGSVLFQHPLFPILQCNFLVKTFQAISAPVVGIGFEYRVDGYGTCWTTPTLSSQLHKIG